MADDDAKVTTFQIAGFGYVAIGYVLGAAAGVITFGGAYLLQRELTMAKRFASTFFLIFSLLTFVPEVVAQQTEKEKEWAEQYVALRHDAELGNAWAQGHHPIPFSDKQEIQKPLAAPKYSVNRRLWKISNEGSPIVRFSR